MSPPMALLNSLKASSGTGQRLSGVSQRRQYGEVVLRTFVTPGSAFLPFSAKAGDGMPQRYADRTRSPPRTWTIGAL